MNEARFKLHPFSIDPRDAGISIEGTVHRDGARLSLAYRLLGRLDNLSIPPMAPQSLRRHELWKETCFEGFIQPVGAVAYWELNLSPAGHWNLYHFDGYRQGMREASTIAALPIRRHQTDRRLEIATEMDLGAFAAGDLRIGVSAVLRCLDGRLGYYALAHPGAKPDFHQPQSFLLLL